MSLGNLSGGPGKYVPVIISAAWSKAVELSQQASDDIETAIALTTPAPRAASPDPIEVPDVPDAPALTALNQSTATALYDSTSVRGSTVARCGSSTGRILSARNASRTARV